LWWPFYLIKKIPQLFFFKKSPACVTVEGTTESLERSASGWKFVHAFMNALYTCGSTLVWWRKKKEKHAPLCLCVLKRHIYYKVVSFFSLLRSRGENGCRRCIAFLFPWAETLHAATIPIFHSVATTPVHGRILFTDSTTCTHTLTSRFCFFLFDSSEKTTGEYFTTEDFNSWPFKYTRQQQQQ
jgi:hypothetical protein